jgi:acyl carrier protein
MTRNIVDELVALIVSELKLDAAKVTPVTPLFEGGLELDSFAVVDLVMRVESHFSIQLSDTDFLPENFTDLGTLGKLVDQYISAAGA